MDENSNEPPSFQAGDVVQPHTVLGDCQWKRMISIACACGVSLEDPWDLGTRTLQPSAVSHSIPYRTVNILASLLKLVGDRHKFIY
jgi:hypothetical protein